MPRLVEEIGVDPSKHTVIEKTRFSMVTPEVQQRIESEQWKNVVLFGIEAHVCILQTALDLRALDVNVHVLTDGMEMLQWRKRTW